MKKIVLVLSIITIMLISISCQRDLTCTKTTIISCSDSTNHYYPDTIYNKSYKSHSEKSNNIYSTKEKDGDIYLTTVITKCE